ncbi:MAG: hypothetical protein RR549_04855 [Oscillospiraceae bacterium]
MKQNEKGNQNNSNFYCINCNRPLERDDIAVHKKLINRGASEFMCKTCLAKFYKCDVSLIEKKIEQFKQQGCLLFK